MSAFGINALLALPFSIYRQFRLEERFGFNRTTARLFCVDLLKQVVLAVVLGGGLVLGVLFLMGASGSLWWLWVWVLVTAAALIRSIGVAALPSQGSTLLPLSGLLWAAAYLCFVASYAPVLLRPGIDSRPG